jgi:hypothetical protein
LCVLDSFVGDNWPQMCGFTSRLSILFH